ncbi:DHS-like NAD/FAD-binding domain-containing protein [Fusarium oxysporum f. sp. albedinis]|nr:DHS-like NAD/FAD-binding domain-containing protein [Fusarium oxysporum f. sp. albedinis]
MRFTNPKSLAVFTALPLLANCFSITETTDYDTVASAIFTGPGLTIMVVTVFGESSMGTFTDGPFGLGSGGILTSGTATGAYLMGNRNVDNGVGAGGQYDYLCAPGTQNINTLQVQLGFDPGYNGVRIEFLFATQEAPSALANMDDISILDASNGLPVQYAFDTNANQINALTIPAPSGGAMVLMISVCDVGDAFNDSGFLVRAEACLDCDYGLDKVEINYAFKTSTLPLGEQPFNFTIPASGTASGTFIVFVEPTGVTTTTSGEPTTTADEITTTGETTTTTDEATITTTAEPTTTTSDGFTATTGEVSTTTQESVATAETTTTTIDEITAMELVSTTGTMTLVVDETTTTTADVTTESVSPTEETTSTEQSTTVVTSKLETLTTDEVSTSMADTTTSIQIESPASTDTKSVPSTTSEVASTSVDQGPVIAPDTTTSESAVSATEELIASKAASTSVSSSVIPEASSESTPSSRVSTVLPSLFSTSTSFAEEGETSTSEVVPETTSAPVEPVASMSQQTPTISSSDAPPATSSPVDGPSNIDTIREYAYKGCLGSADGHPSFNLVGSGANMTTTSCVALARGRAYVGNYDR